MFRSRLLFYPSVRNLLRKGKPGAPFQVNPQPTPTFCVGLLENDFFANTQIGEFASTGSFTHYQVLLDLGIRGSSLSLHNCGCIRSKCVYLDQLLRKGRRK